MTQTSRNTLLNFREELLGSCHAQSSVLAYNSRLAHLEPLAEARFKKESVDEWLENIRKTRSQNSARELVRLAKKFWEFGMERGAWKGLNPFNKKCSFLSEQFSVGGGVAISLLQMKNI